MATRPTTAVAPGPAGRNMRSAVRHCIESLGDTPLSVASRLAAEGVRGCPGQPTECAIARYLKVVIGSERAVVAVEVFQHTLLVTRRNRLPILLRLPPQTIAFIRAFDLGCFPELVEERPAVGAAVSGVRPPSST